jgi:type IV pilus assembly protein PilM
LSRAAGIRTGIYQSGLVRRLALWLDAIPHPLLACEISRDHVAAARWTRNTQSLDGFAVEPLPPGAIVPSAVETNLVNAAAVRAAVGRVFAHLRARGQEVALLIPDPVVRIFVLHFDEFPRAAAEAVPILRWKLKKSVPFEAEETLVSYMRQAPRGDGVDIVTGLSRQRIVREYELLVESADMAPGVVMSSTLASLPLLEDHRPAMLARISGSTLTTAIVREGLLCGYRCTELPSDSARLSPQALLDEIYPVAAYYQDSWREGIQAVRLAGLADRIEEFRGPLEKELRCPVGALLSSAASEGRIAEDVRPLADRQLDALIGWPMNRGVWSA